MQALSDWHVHRFVQLQSQLDSARTLRCLESETHDIELKRRLTVGRQSLLSSHFSLQLGLATGQMSSDSEDSEYDSELDEEVRLRPPPACILCYMTFCNAMIPCIDVPSPRPLRRDMPTYSQSSLLCRKPCWQTQRRQARQQRTGSPSTTSRRWKKRWRISLGPRRSAGWKRRLVNFGLPPTAQVHATVRAGRPACAVSHDVVYSVSSWPPRRDSVSCNTSAPCCRR